MGSHFINPRPHISHSQLMRNMRQPQQAHGWGVLSRVVRLPSGIKKKKKKIVYSAKNIRYHVCDRTVLSLLSTQITSGARIWSWILQRWCIKRSQFFNLQHLHWRNMNPRTPTQQPAPQPRVGLSCRAVLHVFVYSQVLCGQVSCWNTEIGHLLRDRTVQLPGSSGNHLYAFNN